ncbi:MAG: glutathione S-transferase [Burkholderiaceae bacterium]|nr:glutathione S-transferase [Burkholderiaceae bacterium]
MSTIRLCGVRTSNYCNKVRLVLLEKGIAFEEDKAAAPSQDPAFLERSPLGKVPFLEVGGDVLTESRVICEYLEDAYPEKPLLPGDALARAKVRELIEYIELHLELEARALYPAAFLGKSASAETKERVQENLAKGVKGLARLAKFSPYIAGSEFTLADCAAFVHLPIVSMTTKAVFGRDFLEPVAALKPYLKSLGDRPCFRTVTQERKEAAAAARS